MTNFLKLPLILGLCITPLLLPGQTLDPSSILQPLTNSWPTYSGDYTGKRYSALSQINQSNVKNLGLAWTARLSSGSGGPGGRGGFPFGGPSSPTIVGGEGTGQLNSPGAPRIGGAVLEVDGILYTSAPDHAWAVDARDGHEIWHYYWKTRGGTHIGNRGLGMWHNFLYLETPDDYLVCLEAATGKERWHKTISSLEQQYFSTMAPIVVGNHILVGTGDDLDEPGFLQSFDPETGNIQWTFYTVPMKKGDPGMETWPNVDAARHGGAQVWIPGSYDPETHLYIFGTGNPTPAYTAGRDGDNLYTCSLVAVNVETGKMAWYFQTSPHDTHDWDSAQTPILADAPFNGKQRKLVMQAARNGYFFVLDRVTGEHLLTSRFAAANWATGVGKDGRPIRNPLKDSTVAGTLVSAANQGSTNWPPPSFDPDTGLFYLPAHDAFAMYYLTETDPRGSMGLGGKEESGVGTLGDYLRAIDYNTGKIAWEHKWTGSSGNGMLTTAGKLLFASDGSGNLVAFDPANGKILWHSHIGTVSSAAETYSIDGRQYILVAAGDSLFAFSLYQ